MSNLNLLAKRIVSYSCDIKKGENVYIISEGSESKPLVIELIKQIYQIEANPFVETIDTDIQKELLIQCNANQMSVLGDLKLATLKRMDAVIVISALENPYKYSDIPLERSSHYYQNIMQKCFFEYGVVKTKWFYLKYPTNAMAQLFKNSRERFEEYYFKACNFNFEEIQDSINRLVDLFHQTDKVRIKSKGTDLTFSIKDIQAQKSDGKNGLPDGEVFTAPVKDSANGYITFNCPVYFRGTLFENIRLEIKDGLIIKATANETEKLNEIINIDEGSRYLGEFALAFNNQINKPMHDILFDEKIGGSLHIAIGNAYLMTDNGNKSSIHMDIVQIQNKDYGGGEVYFDDRLIRKDGLFVLDELLDLNG